MILNKSACVTRKQWITIQPTRVGILQRFLPQWNNNPWRSLQPRREVNYTSKHMIIRPRCHSLGPILGLGFRTRVGILLWMVYPFMEYYESGLQCLSCHVLACWSVGSEGREIRINMSSCSVHSVFGSRPFQLLSSEHGKRTFCSQTSSAASSEGNCDNGSDDIHQHTTASAIKSHCNAIERIERVFSSATITFNTSDSPFKINLLPSTFQ